MGGRVGGSQGADGLNAAGAAPALEDLAEYGRGEYDPDTGLYEWYDLPPGHPARPAEPGEGRPGGLPSLDWPDVLAEWEALEADLHDLFGIDLTPALLRRRTARWLRNRIAGVLTADTRTARRLGTYTPPAPPPSPFLPRR